MSGKKIHIEMLVMEKINKYVEKLSNVFLKKLLSNTIFTFSMLHDIKRFHVSRINARNLYSLHRHKRV